MHKLSKEEFADHLLTEVFTREFLIKLQPLALERLSRFEQFVDNNSFFFNGSLDYKDMNVIPKGKEKNELFIFNGDEG